MTHGTLPTLDPQAGDALLVVDVQNDFLPGGALPASGGERVVELLNAAIAAFRERRLPVLLTRCWHPPGHCSFHAQGGPWPPHCVVDTWGAGFARGLWVPGEAPVLSKGQRPDVEAYSAFDGTDLLDRLRTLRVRRVVVGGLTTEYCVRSTVLDALGAGLEAVVLADAISGVDAEPGDAERALAELQRAGATFAHAGRTR